MSQYYSEKLSAERLKKCYDIAPARTVQYLEEEIEFVKQLVSSDDTVLEVGCGYGRVVEKLEAVCENVVGIDLSLESLISSTDLLQLARPLQLLQMDAGQMAFKDEQFDVVVCIQNGVSAFKIDPSVLFRECMRITKEGGICLFSSYAEEFWEDRLEWFIAQSEEGLLGEIDWSSTKDGVIACKDGFRSRAFSRDDFLDVTSALGLDASITVIDSSSIFCVVRKKEEY